MVVAVVVSEVLVTGKNGPMTEQPPRSRLVGQLLYLFEDDPASARRAGRQAPKPASSRDDRTSRARTQCPNDNDVEIQQRVAEFDARISAADVEAAIAERGPRRRT